MAQKIPFRHASINMGGVASALAGGGGAGMLQGGPQTTAIQPMDESMLEQGTDQVAPLGQQYSANPYSVNAHWYDYLFRPQTVQQANQMAFQGNQAMGMQGLQQQGALNSEIALRNYQLQTNPTLLQQGNDAAQALAAAQRAGADNRLQTTLDRMQQYNFSGNANSAAPLRPARENPYTTATDLDTMYGQPEINSIGLNRARNLGEVADTGTVATLAARPYMSDVARSGAAADIYGNQFRIAQNQYGNALTTAKLPNAPLEGQSQQLAAITGNNLDATKSGQTTAYLQDNPNFVGQGMQSGQDELRARIGAMSRFDLSPSMMGVFTDGNNHVTGSVVNPAPLPGMLPPTMGNTYKTPILDGSANPPPPFVSNAEIDNHIRQGTISAPNPAIAAPVAPALGIPAPTPKEAPATATTANQSPSAIDFNSPTFSPYIDPQTGKYVGPQKTQTQTMQQAFNKWLIMQGLR